MAAAPIEKKNGRVNAAVVLTTLLNPLKAVVATDVAVLMCPAKVLMEFPIWDTI
jgi:hypothetical protein